MAKTRKISFELTKEECFDLAYWIEKGIFDTVRNDPDCDSLLWIKKWIERVEHINETSTQMAMGETAEQAEKKAMERLPAEYYPAYENVTSSYSLEELEELAKTPSYKLTPSQQMIVSRYLADRES